MLINWWRGKTAHKRRNWLMISLLLCLLAGGMVEAYSWLALIGAAPAFVFVWLECVA